MVLSDSCETASPGALWQPCGPVVSASGARVLGSDLRKLEDGARPSLKEAQSVKERISCGVPHALLAR